LENNKTNRSRFLIRTAENDLSEKLTLAFVMFQSVLDDWSMKDRRIVKEFLLCDDYKKIAKRLKKDVSLLWRRRKSLKIAEFQVIKKLITLLVENVPCQK
jgi:iron uptake system EfeUOB component EfeO/EfeM